MSITLKDAFNNNVVSMETLKNMNTRCRCGSLLRFNDSVQELICSNNKCIYKTVDRITNFINKLNIEINQNDIIKIISKLNIVTPYQILMFKEAIDAEVITCDDIHNLKDVVRKIENIKQQEYYVYNIVEMCGIKDIEEVAYAIFDGFNSLEEAYNEIELGQILFINERLGIKSSEGSVLSVEIYNKLIELKDELIFGEIQLKVKKYEKEILNIAFNDNILPYINKRELIDYMNYRYRYKFNIVSNVTNRTHILVKNSELQGIKYRTAKLINDNNIADNMNKGLITFNDIGKYVDNELKQLGCKVYIDTLENLLYRLDIMHEYIIE